MKRHLLIVAVVGLMCWFVSSGFAEEGEQLKGPDPLVDGPSLGATKPLDHFSRINIVVPTGMQIIRHDTGDAVSIRPNGEIIAKQDTLSHWKLIKKPDLPETALYSSLQVYPGHPKTEAYLAHHPIRVQLTDEDIAQVVRDVLVTKVIYLPHSKRRDLAIASTETLNSTRFSPLADVITQAKKHGTILAVIRVSNKKPETVHFVRNGKMHTRTLFGSQLHNILDQFSPSPALEAEIKSDTGVKGFVVQNNPKSERDEYLQKRVEKLKRRAAELRKPGQETLAEQFLHQAERLEKHRIEKLKQRADELFILGNQALARQFLDQAEQLAKALKGRESNHAESEIEQVKQIAGLYLKTGKLDLKTGLEVGNRAPNIVGKGLELERIDLETEAAKAKYVLLNFWATWSGPSRKDFPYLQRLNERYGNRGLKIIGICLDSTRDAASQKAKDAKLDYAHLFNTDGPQSTAKLYGVTSIPQTYLLDSNLKIVAKWTGVHGTPLERRIDQLFAAAELAKDGEKEEAKRLAKDLVDREPDHSAVEVAADDDVAESEARHELEKTLEYFKRKAGELAEQGKKDEAERHRQLHQGLRRVQNSLSRPRRRNNAQQQLEQEQHKLRAQTELLKQLESRVSGENLRLRQLQHRFLERQKSQEIQSTPEERVTTQRIFRLQQAAESLQQAGLNEQAEYLRRQEEELKEEIGRRFRERRNRERTLRHHQHDAPHGEVRELLQGLRHEVRELRAEVREMHGLLEKRLNEKERRKQNEVEAKPTR